MAHTRPEQARGPLRVAWLLWASLALALGSAIAAYAWPFSVDDAFIVSRYARRLAAGQGYTFQAGSPATDGITGPLWLLAIAFGVRLGADAVLVGKVLGVGCMGGAQAAVIHASMRRSGGRARMPVLVALLATSAPIWVWAIGGLETALATLCVTLMLLSAVAQPAAQPWRVGLFAALVPWLRPELVPLALASVGYATLRAPRGGRTAFFLALIGLLSVLAFRWLMFGHFLPLSAHAKPASLAHGAEYVLTCLRSPAALSVVPLLALAARKARRTDRALLLAILLHAGLVMLAGGDWMAGARLFVPIAPAVCFLAAVALARLAVRRRAAAIALTALALGLRGLSAYAETSAARASGQLRELRLPALLSALREVPDPIAILDIGAVGYFGRRQLIDLGGLTEAQVAYAAGGHIAKRIDAQWLQARAPAAIVLHSREPPRVDREGHVRWFAGYPVERHVLAMPWVARDYRASQVIRYDRDYFYLVLTRELAPRP